jgi:hypothetical protein
MSSNRIIGRTQSQLQVDYGLQRITARGDLEVK